MAQPLGQVALKTANASEYFWYAQGSNGVWDAKNSALLSKTGTAGVATENSAQVVLGDAATHYSLASSITLTAPFTVRFKARKTSGKTTNSMALGNYAGTNSFVWLDDGTGKVKLRHAWSGGGTGDISSTSAVTTTSQSVITITMSAGNAWAIYQDNTLVGSGTTTGSGSPQFIVSAICGGYSGGSFRLNGALEFVHLIPGSALTSGDISTLNADPYAVLDVGASSAPTTISATLANVSASITSGSGTRTTTITATLGNVLGSVANTGNTSMGTFTSEVLKDYAGNVLASVLLNYVRFYSDTTGALVLSKTGISTNGSGIVSFSDPALVSGTTYRVDWETSSGSRRMPRKAAA